MEHPEDADLILMNTCAIRKNAEDKVLGEIGSLKRLKRKKPDLLFGLCGCMAQEEDVVAKLLETYRHVNLIFGTHNIHRLPELLYDVMVNGNRSVEVLSKEGDVIENLPVRRFGKHKAWVNIMYGCDKFCTYCIVPYTRGKERSRMMEDILEEIVGDILDEYDEDEITIRAQKDNSLIIDGLAYLEDVEEELDADFGDTEFETLNGYLTNILGHIPTDKDVDTSIKAIGYCFTILSIGNKTIGKVKVERDNNVAV